MAYVAAGTTPTTCPGPTGPKLAGMDPTITRLAFHVLVLLACAIAAWRGAEQTPTREVVELVSVVYKPARVQAVTAGESTNAQTATPTPEANADHGVASAKRLAQMRAPVVVQHAKTGPRPEPAASRSSARAPAAAQSVIKVSCRQPTCRAATPAPKAVSKRAAIRQGRQAEPPLPAVFVPVRKLGLYLQARLGTARDAKAPGKRRR